MHRVLLVVAGPLEGQEYVIDEKLEIGRSGDLAIQLIASSVSRRHAEICVEANGTTTLRDLGSRNGTFIRGERVERCILAHGTTFEIGNSSFKFEQREGAAPSSDEELQLSLLSGPAEDITELFDRSRLMPNRATRPTTIPQAVSEAEGCADPLHEIARAKGWRFCPVCGEPPVERDTGEHPVAVADDLER